MLQLNEASETVVYRLTLVLPDTFFVLARRSGTEAVLPRVGVPKVARAAEAIQKAIQAAWSTSAIILDFFTCLNGVPGCVAHLRTIRIPDGLIPVRLDRFSTPELTEQEKAAVSAISNADADDRGCFSHVDWPGEAMQWIGKEAGHVIQFTGEIEQYNASGGFALARFPSQNGPAYWLKATGKPNLREFGITAALAEICPQYLPPILAMRRDWNAWVMEEFGRPMEHEVGIPVLQGVTKALARLQRETAGYTERLLVAGAADHRPSRLRKHADEVIANLDAAMARLNASGEPRISKDRLREIGSILEDTCSAAEELSIPDTVIHNDLNRGNILIRGNDCVFTDWCEAAIGNPFVTLQHLLLLLRREKNDPQAATILESYKNCWLDLLPSSKIDKMFGLMPLLAVASHIYGQGSHSQAFERNDCQELAYVCKLARYMDRAAKSVPLKETLCCRA